MITLLFLLTIFAPSLAELCSVSSCAYLGARTTCCPSTPCLPIACAVWRVTQPPTICDFPCSSQCLPPAQRPVATDGMAYCNNCTMTRASCQSGFDIVGPIDHGVSFAIEVEVLSTPTPILPSPSLTPVFTPVVTPEFTPVFTPVFTPIFTPIFTPQISPESTAEVTTDQSGEVALSLSSEVEKPSACSTQFCSRYGADSACDLPSESTTCREWSNMADRNECFIFCSYECTIGPSAPLGSDGHRYCSLCHLRVVSCRSGFEIYGPVNDAVGPKPDANLVTL